MSAKFILEYAGAPVGFTGDTLELVAVYRASRFSGGRQN